MNKVYSRINWENEPSTKTPLNEHNLNKIDFAVDEIDNRVIELDATKAKNTDLQTLSTRVDNLILNAGDSSVEAADARVTEDGTVYDTLKNRLDAEHSNVTSDISQLSNDINKLTSLVGGIPTPNLFDKDKAIVGQILPAGNVDTDSRFYTSETLLVDKNKKYTVSGNAEIIGISTYNAYIGLGYGWDLVEKYEWATFENNAYVFDLSKVDVGSEDIYIKASVFHTRLNNFWIVEGDKIVEATNIEEINDRLVKIENVVDVPTPNLFNKDNAINGNIEASGGVSSDTRFYTSEQIIANKDKKYTVSGNAERISIATYPSFVCKGYGWELVENYDWVTFENNAYVFDLSKVDVGSEDIYIRASVFHTRLNNFWIVEGDKIVKSASYESQEQLDESINSTYVINSNTNKYTGERINNIIEELKNKNINSLKMIGEFDIEQSIELPSDFTLYLENCTINLEDNANCNIIRSKNIISLEEVQNISVIGDNNSVLNGNYSNQEININSFERIGFLFYNVKNFDVSGFKIINTHGWAFSFESGCEYGKIHDLRIEQDGGNINQDGIDIRGGCHDIEIYNISGYCHDDCIACTSMLGNVLQVVNNGRNGKDIYNINIHDIFMESGYCNVIDLIAHDGCQTYNININNIVDTSPNNKDIASDGLYNATINIGTYDFTNYAISGTRGTKEDLRNININNVVSCSNKAIRIGWSCKDVFINGVECRYNCNYLLHTWSKQELPFDVENLTINNMKFNNVNGNVFYFQHGRIDNCVLSNCDVVNCNYLLTDSESAELKYFYLTNVCLRLFTRLYYMVGTLIKCYLNNFHIPLEDSEIEYYPTDYKNGLIIGNNMPVK